jgi:hypothetical protein
MFHGEEPKLVQKLQVSAVLYLFLAGFDILALLGGTGGIEKTKPRKE